MKRIKKLSKTFILNIKNIFGYLKSKSFLDIGCGINHIYKEALLYQLIQKKYKALGMDLCKFLKNTHILRQEMFYILNYLVILLTL